MNGNMNGKDFFELLGDLDEDIVEDAWTEESGIVTIIEEHSLPGFLKIAAVAAACIALMTAGIYGFIRMKPFDFTSPGESGSSCVESSALESESSESGGNSYASMEDAKFKALDNLEEYAPSLIPIEADHDAFVQKYDEINFAVIYVEYTNASKDKPVYITVCDATYSALNFPVPVSETIKITGSGKYVVRYTEQYPVDSVSYLHAETCGGSYGDGGYRQLDGLILRGSWLP